MGAALTDRNTATCCQHACKKYEKYKKYQKTWLPQILPRQTYPAPVGLRFPSGLPAPDIGDKAPKG